MIKFILKTFIVFLFFSCSKNKGEEGKNVLANKEIKIKKELSSKLVNTDLGNIRRDTLTPNDILLLYQNSKNSDTILAYKVYNLAKLKKKLEGEDFYIFQLYDQNKEKFRIKIKEMFFFEKRLDNLFNQIQIQINQTRKFNRELVLEAYEEYNSIEGEDYAYLSSVRDSFTLKMADKMFANKNADKQELKRIAKWILEDFKDSTYVKKLIK